MSGDPRARGRRPPAWLLLLGAYLLSRLAVLAATGVVGSLELSGARCGDAVPRPVEGLTALLGCWDTRWYLRVATEWYPDAVPAQGVETTLAFFPGYPALVALPIAAGVPPLAAALAVSLAAGFAATLLVHRLTLAVADEGAALRAGLLFVAFPGAAVLSWGYSEGTAAALAALALLLLARRRWVAAGVAAALAGTVRGDVWLAVSAAAAVAAAVELRRGGDRRALLAAGIAPLGGLAFVAALWLRTGSPAAWTLAQTRGWDQHMDWGTHAVNTVVRVLTDPLDSPSRVVNAVSVLLFAGGAVLLARRPWLPAPWLAYAVVVVAVGLASSQVGFRPRALLLAVPVFAAAGIRLGPAATGVAVAATAVAQVLFVVLWLGAPGIVPP